MSAASDRKEAMEDVDRWQKAGYKLRHKSTGNILSFGVPAGKYSWWLYDETAQKKGTVESVNIKRDFEVDR